jgi:hypothetical protein
VIVLRRTYKRELARRDEALNDIKSTVDAYITSRRGEEPRLTFRERYLQYRTNSLVAWAQRREHLTDEMLLVKNQSANTWLTSGRARS